MCINKLSTAIAGILALFAMVSTAEAKVCLLPIASLCDTEVTTKTTPDNEPEKFECNRKQYDLDEPLEAEDEYHECSCHSCTDDSGTYYSCSCHEKYDPCMGLPTVIPEPEDGVAYECEEIEGLYGKCYSCEKSCKTAKDCKPCVEIYNPDTCKCEKVEESCAKLCFKFKFTDYEPLSKKECEAAKDKYGIKYCIDAEKDYFAGAVKQCGGIDEIPTEDEAFKLGQCMFDPTATYSTIYGNRYDGYFISYGGKGKDLEDHVFVWLNWERDRDNRNAIVRMYDYYGTIPYFAEKDGSLYYISTGAIPRAWENRSILSRTLCRVH